MENLTLDTNNQSIESSSTIAPDWQELNLSFEHVRAIADPAQREYELIQAANRFQLPLESYRRLMELDGQMDQLLLQESCDRIALISDPVQQEFQIGQEAKRLQISVESYRRMLETRLQFKQQASLHPFLKPASVLDQRIGDFINWFKKVSFFELATVFGQGMLLAAMFSFFLEAPQRQQQAINDNLAVVRERNGETYSQARNDALITLNKLCVSMTGMQAPNAHLANLQLNQCAKFEITPQTFRQFPPQFFQPAGFDLSNANLEGADLSGVNLAGANLQGANLKGADLENANLKGANLKGANLEGANFRRAELEGTNFEGANLKKARLSRANAQRANFFEADLQDTRIIWTDLRQANLYRSNLSNSNLTRANLRGADLYKANLTNASLRHADLRERANLREADLTRTNLQEAKFWAVHQVKRGKNWEAAQKSSDWEAKILSPNRDRSKVGLVVAVRGKSTLFESYREGMEIARSQQTEILPLRSGRGVANEASAIAQLTEQGVDAIILRPEDPEASVEAIQKAYEAGVIVVTVGDCIDPKAAQRFVFACYKNDGFKMGEASAQALVNWVNQTNASQPVKVATVDGALYDRNYPVFQGFVSSMNASGIGWKEIASTDATMRSEVEKVKTMLQQNPDIQVLWGGANATTEIAVKAVKDLNLQDKIAVFGVLDTSQDKIEMLIDPKNPLQAMTDQKGRESGQRAMETILSVLNEKVPPYQIHTIESRTLLKREAGAAQSILDAEKPKVEGGLEKIPVIPNMVAER